MKLQFPETITCESFPDAWWYTDHQRRTAKQKAAGGSIAGFFSHLLFAVLFVAAANCLIHDHLKGGYCDFLETLPYLLPWWNIFKGYVLTFTDLWYLQALVTLAVIYASCFLVNGILVLLARLIYHPLRRKLPVLSDKENAEALLELAREARRHARRTECGSSIFSLIIFALLCFGCLILYGMKLDNFTDLMDIFSGFLLKNMVLNLMVISLGLYMVFTLFDTVHAKTVQPLVKHTIPYSLVADLEHYMIFCGEDTASLSPEELDAQRKAASGELLAQALEAERGGEIARARELISKAAHSGNPEAMEHFARHYLLCLRREPAKYWLQKCVDSGEASETAVNHLKRMKRHQKVKVQYLK